MTEAQLRSKVANWLVAYLGVVEGSSKHLAILDMFNNSKLCTVYKMTAKDSWCATAASTTFIANGLAGAPGSGKLFECVECSCGRMIALAQKQGIWVENDKYVPKTGDLVLYDWGDRGTGDNGGWPDHVGVVVSSTGSTFKVIEGNYNDTVGYRTMVVNGTYIRGFITPNYAKFATVAEAAKPATPPAAKPTTSTTTKPSTSSSSTSLNKTCKFKGTVTGVSAALNVRSWAGTAGSKVLRTIKKGTVVEVCDIVQDKDGDDWYYIKESGKYGFVFADYIAKQTTTTTTTSKPAGLNKTCKFKGSTTTSLNVRSWAGVEYGKLRVLPKGRVVEVCDEVKATSGKMWYYIKESGKYGFVCSDYIARR